MSELKSFPSMRIVAVDALPLSAKEADFSFEIESEILPPFDASPFRTRPLPARHKAYGLDAALFEPREDQHIALIVAFERQVVAGYVAVGRSWNGCAEIEDIAVARPFRGRGLAGALMDRAVRAAHGAGLTTVRLETQSNNVAACRFYQRYGFVLGGYDEYLYCALEDHRGETALFWYLTP